MLKIATDLDVDVFRPMVQGLPEVTHVYGDPQPEVSKLEWMTYVGKLGTISFCRHLYLEHAEACANLTASLSEILKVKIPVQSVSLLRTMGSVGVHIDEARSSAINIGLIDSELAVTRLGKYGKLILIDSFYTDTVVDTNSAYCLNVGLPHRVIAPPKTLRYLITCSLAIPYATLVSKFEGLADT